jgi:hypothetical protein
MADVTIRRDEVADTQPLPPPDKDFKDKPTPLNRPMTVSGGSTGYYAQVQDIELLARLSEEVGMSLATIRSRCHDVVEDGEVLRSALLDPSGVAKFEAALLGAIDGRNGLTWLSAELQAQGPVLRTIAGSYRAVDQTFHKAYMSLLWTAGYATGYAGGKAAPAVIAALVAAGLGAYLVGDKIDWQRLVTDHPDVVQGIVTALPGGITGGGQALLGPVLGPLYGPTATDVQSGARMLGSLYPDGEAVVTPLAGQDTDPRMKDPPRNIDDTLGALDYRNAQAHDANQGQIDVRLVKDAAGYVTGAVVDIPGTKDPNLEPLGHYKYLNDASTNVHALAGEQTAYEQGVAEALRQAGVQPGTPVMLVGHSQGAIVATQAAADPQFTNEFNVTHVVSAAGPIGNIQVPDNIKVLAIENTKDLVPHVDGTDNPDRPNWTTVQFEQQNGTIVGNHSMHDVYAAMGEQIDQSPNASVKDFKGSAGAFFNGTEVESKVYQVTRKDFVPDASVPR